MPRGGAGRKPASDRKVRVSATQPAKVRSKTVAGNGQQSRNITRAKYETKHFSFEAFGDTRVGAEAALRLGLKHHANQHNIEWGWEGNDEFQFDEIVMGCAYRDNERIK